MGRKRVRCLKEMTELKRECYVRGVLPVLNPEDRSSHSEKAETIRRNGHRDFRPDYLSPKLEKSSLQLQYQLKQSDLTKIKEVKAEIQQFIAA